jgi:hypothetical protein
MSSCTHGNSNSSMHLSIIYVQCPSNSLIHLQVPVPCMELVHQLQEGQKSNLPLEHQVHRVPAPNHPRIPSVLLAYLGKTSKQLRITRVQHQRNNQAERWLCLVSHVYTLQEKTCPECHCPHAPVHHSCVVPACPTNRHRDREIGA